MAKTHHYDLGDAILRIDENERDGYLTTIVQLDAPMGVVKLLEAQTHKMIDCLNRWAGHVIGGAVDTSKNDAIIAELREQLAQAHADNDLAQAEIARLTADKPKRGRKPKADEPPADWDAVPAEPPTDQGAQGPGDNVWTPGEWVEFIATGAFCQVDRLFPDNPAKVQVVHNGLPQVVDVASLRKVNPSELDGTRSGDTGLDVAELVTGLEAAGLTVITDVPTVADSVPTVGTEPELEVTELDPEKLRRALYDDSKLYDFTPDEMKALIAEVLGAPKSTKDMHVGELSAVLREMHERGRKARMPF